MNFENIFFSLTDLDDVVYDHLFSPHFRENLLEVILHIFDQSMKKITDFISGWYIYKLVRNESVR